MWKWLTRVWQAGDAAVRAHAVYALFGIIATAFTTLVAAMSVIANWVTNFHSTYGLGAVIFVGIGIACVITLVISAALVAWRVFNPLPKTPTAPQGVATAKSVELTAVGISGLGGLDEKIAELERKITDIANQQLTNDRALDGMIGTVEDKVDRQSKTIDDRTKSLESMIHARCDQLGAIISRFSDEVNGHIKRFNELGVTQHTTNESVREKVKEIQAALKTLTERQSTHERVVANGTYLLIRGIRAREALRFVLKPNDEIARPLGKRLAQATDYPDAPSWLADYETWKAAAKTIDNLMIEWTRGQPTEYTSLFDLKGHHYAQAPMPPNNIRSDDTIDAYRTVWQVQSSYTNLREGIFSFFEERAVLPG